MNHPIHRRRLQKCGWLKKQGGVVKSWHRRWFALNGDCLFYFAKQDDLGSLGSIFLPGNRVIEHPKSSDEPDKFLFEILPGKTQNKMTPNHDSYVLWAASEDERYDWIKSIRKVMFSSIGGAIFGQSIDETMEYEHKQGRRIPYIIEQSVEFIQTYGIETEGIFRLPGRTVLMRELKERFDCGEKVVLNSSEVDVHSVASLLKQYLRELPESIIPCSLYQKFMNKAMSFQSAKNEDQKLEYVISLETDMSDLPVDNYNILEYLCTFLEEVASKEKFNKMTCANLATVFGPNIIRHIDDNPELFMATADIAQQLTFMLISYRAKVFTLSYDTPSSDVIVEDLLQFADEEVTDEQVLKPNIVSGIETISSLADLMLLDHPAVGHTLSNQSDKSVSSPVSLRSELHSDFSRNSSSSSETLSINETSDTASSNPPFVNGRPIRPKRPSKEKHNINKKNDEQTLSTSYQNNNDNGFVTIGQLHKYDDQPAPLGFGEVDTLGLEQAPEQRISQLESMVTQTKKDMLEAKVKYDSKIKALFSESKKMTDVYENTIAVQKRIAASREKDLMDKLHEERIARAEAVEKVIQLQAQLHQYQLHFGELQN